MFLAVNETGKLRTNSESKPSTTILPAEPKLGATRGKVGLAQYRRVEEILEREPALKPMLGDKTTVERGNRSAQFYQGAVIVVAAILAEDMDISKLGVDDVVSAAVRILKHSPLPQESRHALPATAPDVSKPPASAVGAQEEAPNRSGVLEPWATPVNGEKLLDDLFNCYQRHVVLPRCGYVACALWALHTHCYQLFKHTPRLHAKSPTKRCGKTVLLSLLNETVREPMLASDLSGAVLFRVIDHVRPSVLIDEWDSMSSNGKIESLRNVLNSGFERTGGTWRTERVPGGGIEPRRFSTFAPIAVASIGELPETVADRAILIPMRRKLPGEKIENIRDFDGTELRRKCLRWVMDNQEALEKAKPKIPRQLHDRQADCWLVLLALAETVGGKWGKEAREAAIALSATTDDTEMIGELLLRDARQILTTCGTDRIFSKVLLHRLQTIDDALWSTVSNGRPLTANKLSRLLSAFGIISGTIRIGDQTDKGYYVKQFTDAWSRYVQ